MAFSSVNNQLQFVAKNGNPLDVVNTIRLLCAFDVSYSTGKVPNVRKLRGGIQASAIAGLQATLVSGAGQVNFLHTYNLVRQNFFSYLAEADPTIISSLSPEILGLTCLSKIPPTFVEALQDCQGNDLGTPTDLESYITLWNQVKVPTDEALCGTTVPFIFDTGLGFLMNTYINPDNAQIPYNATDVTNFISRTEFVNRGKRTNDNELAVNPKTIALFSKEEY